MSCLDDANMDDALKDAIKQKLSARKNSCSNRVLSKRDLYGALSEAVVLDDELFVVKDTSMDGLKRTEATCAVWRQNGRSGVLQRQEEVKLADALHEWNKSPPHGLFDIDGLDRTVSSAAERLLEGFDFVDEGELISLRETFTQYHVEDSAMANLQTLQRVHDRPGDAFKVWIFTKNQTQRRLQFKTPSVEMIEKADYVLLQLEGQTMYVPPLLYHAVLTCYSKNVVAEDRFTVLSGRFFADTREGSLWRMSLPVWVQNHHTGYRHGSKESVFKRFAQFLDVKGEKRPSKKQKRSLKAQKASFARWKRNSKNFREVFSFLGKFTSGVALMAPLVFLPSL